VAPDTTTVATVVRLDQQACISCIGQVDPRLVARVEALCDRAATLASQAAALSMEAARLRAGAESTLRLLPCGRDSDLGGDAENWLRVLPVAERGPLSSRQAEVAELVAAGLTNKQIAKRLVVTERTVETHLERIFARLDIRSRAQLARWVAEHELVERSFGA